MKIQGEGITKCYNEQMVLSNISFSLEEESSLAIMGESGSGKSTLGRIIAAMESPDQGNILYNGKAVRGGFSKEKRDLSRKIQVVFQDAFGAVHPKFTVEVVLKEPLIILKKPQHRKILLEHLECVGLEKIPLQQKARSLSGGQLQRLCIARALLMEPEVLVLDEALSGLDYLVQKQMLKLLGDLKENFHLSYVFIVHDFHLAYYLCDEVLFLHQGRGIDHINLHHDDFDIKDPNTKDMLKDFLETKNRDSNTKSQY